VNGVVSSSCVRELPNSDYLLSPKIDFTQMTRDTKLVQKENADLLSLGAINFVFLHLACLLVLWVKFSWLALTVGAVCYLVRMFGITAGFHRYFSHRSYRTSRAFQFLLAWLGTSAGQRGPLWWAAHHRHHHRCSDSLRDIHSPVTRSFFHSHIGWVMCRKHDTADLNLVKDLSRYPELRWLDHFFYVPQVMLAAGLTLVGGLLERYTPGWQTSASQMLIYGYALSTVLLYHAPFSVNSVAHKFGRRRFAVKDESRNNYFVALITLGEGFHNNHHYYPASERQGFYWWELDVTHYCLKALAWCQVVWNLQTPPDRILINKSLQK
jgi:stearoyl-CoA desaturase (Delta-9 desaturase)